MNEDWERTLDARSAIREASHMPGWRPVFSLKGEKSWVEIEYPARESLEALSRFLDTHEGVTWTLAQDRETLTSKIGFRDPKHAVMFKLMLP